MSVPAMCHILGNQCILLKQREKKPKRLFSSLAFFFFFNEEGKLTHKPSAEFP